MRHRRAYRCRLRALVAIEAGFLEDAREALEEARRLDPHSPDLPALDTALSSAMTPDAPSRWRHLWEFGWQRRRSVGAAVAAVAVLSLATWLFSVDSTTASAPDAAPVTFVQPSVARDLARPPQMVDHVAVRHEVTMPVQIVRGRRSDETPTTVPAVAAVPRLPQSVDTSGSVALPVVAIAEPPRPDAAVANAPAIAREETGPPDAAPVPGTPEPAAIANETARVRSVLSRYEAAYSALDAQAASSLLPHIDAAALGRAFDSLASQQVSLGDCRVTLTGASARATCAGRTTWVPKVGGGRHTEPRRWTFELQQAGDDWRIVQAMVR